VQDSLSHIVTVNAVGADEEHDVRPGVLRPFLAHPFHLGGGAILDLGAETRDRGVGTQVQLVGMEHEPAGGAFDVHWPAPFAVLAEIGDHGVGLGVALPLLFQ
jgi:hypothetical protein